LIGIQCHRQGAQSATEDAKKNLTGGDCHRGKSLFFFASPFALFVPSRLHFQFGKTHRTRALPETPLPTRPLTPKARRRSWNEPAVRAWWLAALLVLVAFSWIFLAQMFTARRGLYRVDHWTRIPVAKIVMIGNTTRSAYLVAPEDLSYNPVKLTYIDTSGTPRKLEGILEAQRAPVHPGQEIPVLVDPSHPDRWTDRVVPVSLAEELIIPTLLLPLTIILAALAVWQRQRMLKLWRTGVLREGTVLDRKNSATAPKSAVLRCTIDASRDKRVLSVTVPRSTVRLGPGDPISLVTPPGGSGRAIAAVLYE
jgi:hypothetical protein